MDERRVFPRIPLLTEAWVIRGDVRQHVRTLDLSLGGACLEMKSPAPSGTEVEFELRLPDGSGPHRISALVAWSRVKTVGLRFANLDSEVKKLLHENVGQVLDELRELENQKTPT